jgi:hypothetical protein
LKREPSMDIDPERDARRDNNPRSIARGSNPFDRLLEPPVHQNQENCRMSAPGQTEAEEVGQPRSQGADPAIARLDFVQRG